VKDLLEQLQRIYNKLKNENEIAIIEKYSYFAKCYTIVLVGKYISLNLYTQLHILFGIFTKGIYQRYIYQDYEDILTFEMEH